MLKSVEHQEPQVAKTILRKKDKVRGPHTHWFQYILQNYSRQNSMVLVYKDRYTTMEEEEFRNKPLHLFQLAWQ